MKFRNLIYILIATLTISFVGCEKKYDDNTRITYYPTFEFGGESVVLVDLGSTYTDAPVTASEDGVALEVNVTVSGEMTGYSGSVVDVNTIDKYTITYAATNSDGYDGVVTREVLVVPPTGDLVTSIEGLYYGNVQRTPAFAVTAQYSDMAYIFISKTGDNTYALSDALGGYYYIGRNYGYDLAFQGTVITATDIPNNSFTFTQAFAPGFGNVADLSEFVVDSSTKTISFTATCDFANGVFYVQLEQIQ